MAKMPIIPFTQGKIRCKEGWIGDLCQVFLYIKMVMLMRNL